MSADEQRFYEVIGAMLGILDGYKRGEPIPDEFWACNRLLFQTVDQDESGYIVGPSDTRMHVALGALKRAMEGKGLIVELAEREALLVQLSSVAARAPDWKPFLDEYIFPVILSVAGTKMEIHSFMSMLQRACVSTTAGVSPAFWAMPSLQLLGEFVIFVLPLVLIDTLLDNPGLADYAKRYRIQAYGDDWGVFSSIFRDEKELAVRASRIRIEKEVDTDHYLIRFDEQ